MSEFFDKLTAIEALYELHRQGFRFPNLRIMENGELYMGCGGNKDGDYPSIEGDFSSSWATDGFEDATGSSRDRYWWIFD